MKKCLVILFALTFVCSVTQAMPPEKVSTLATKLSFKNRSYYVLSDNTCWEVINLTKRSRSFREWWNNVRLVPESFESLPEKWELGTVIDLYPRNTFPNIPFENASNKEELSSCSYVLIHSVTKQILFAKPLAIGECLFRVRKDARDDGYDVGYSRGHNVGYTQGYNQGHGDGYHKGYSEGFSDGVRQGKIIFSS